MALLAKRLGHEVTTVGRFADATERLAQPGARYDALLVDVHLDEAHTGFDLFDHLRTAGQGHEDRLRLTKVLLHNADYTPTVVVVLVLREDFAKSDADPTAG